MRKLILLAAIFVLVGANTAQAADPVPNPTLTQAAQRIEPRVTSVTCVPSMLGYGQTLPSTGEIWLNAYLCNPLKMLYGGYLVNPGRAGAALITLTHETLHVTADFSEARTECVAFQYVDNVLRLWKTPYWLRPTVLDKAYQDHYNFIDSVPRYRNDTKCRRDGAWDTTPYDGRWP